MEDWKLALSAIGLVISLMVVVAPLAYKLGTLGQSNASAHKRIDTLEKTLAEEFRELRLSMERQADITREAIDKAWLNCPAAGHAHKIIKNIDGG